jgi:probable F420-dependent oxidoreductase
VHAPRYGAPVADARSVANALGPIGLWSSGLLAMPPAELQQAARRLEELGFGALWVPESTWTDPFVGAAIVLAGTERLRVVTGVARIHARTPSAMSNAWRGLSAAFPDRFVLGLGVSHQVTVERMGQSYARPLSAMRRYLDDLENARWDGPALGDSRPTHMVLAALGPKMLALAAERTDGAHPYTSTAGHSAEARVAMGSVPLLAPEVKVVFETDPSKARAIARRSLPLALPNYANNLVRSGFDPDAVRAVSDDVVDALVGWGNDDAVHAHLRSYLDAGADHVAAQVLSADGDPAPVDAWRRLARMFATS